MGIGFSSGGHLDPAEYPAEKRALRDVPNLSAEEIARKKEAS